MQVCWLEHEKMSMPYITLNSGSPQKRGYTMLCAGINEQQRNRCTHSHNIMAGAAYATVLRITHSFFQITWPLFYICDT